MDLAKRQTTKSVYSCLVVGPRDAGKTTVCQVGRLTCFVVQPVPVSYIQTACCVFSCDEIYIYISIQNPCAPSKNDIPPVILFDISHFNVFSLYLLPFFRISSLFLFPTFVLPYITLADIPSPWERGLFSNIYILVKRYLLFIRGADLSQEKAN